MTNPKTNSKSIEIEIETISSANDSDDTTNKEEATIKREEVQEKATKRKETNERKENDNETTIETKTNNNEDEDEETIPGYEEDIESKPAELKGPLFEKHGRSTFIGNDQYMRIKTE